MRKLTLHIDVADDLDDAKILARIRGAGFTVIAPPGDAVMLSRGAGGGEIEMTFYAGTSGRSDRAMKSASVEFPVPDDWDAARIASEFKKSGIPVPEGAISVSVNGIVTMFSRDADSTGYTPNRAAMRGVELMDQRRADDERRAMEADADESVARMFKERGIEPPQRAA